MSTFVGYLMSKASLQKNSNSIYINFHRLFNAKGIIIKNSSYSIYVNLRRLFNVKGIIIKKAVIVFISTFVGYLMPKASL